MSRINGAAVNAVVRFGPVITKDGHAKEDDKTGSNKRRKLIVMNGGKHGNRVSSGLNGHAARRRNVGALESEDDGDGSSSDSSSTKLRVGKRLKRKDSTQHADRPAWRKAWKRGKKNSKGSKELHEAALVDLARSGLSPKDFKHLQLEVLTRNETDDFVGEPRASYRIPYFDLDGRQIAYSRVRFLEGKKGKFSKKTGSFRYSQPFNSAPHVYFPPYFNWREICADPTQRLLITEGEKKAAKACRAGIACIALGGVYGFKAQKRLWDLIPELQQITWKDRVVEICYDADVMLKSEVRSALTGLAFTLSQEYSPAEINFVFLDAETAGTKTGLDDYLKEHGPDKFDELPRQEYRANARIQLLNQKLCYVEKHGKFFDIRNRRFFSNFGQVRDAYMNEGEELIDAKRSMLVVDLWARSANRRSVENVVYEPGIMEEVTTNNELNLWKPADIRPKKGNPKRWLDLVDYIMREPEYADWFLKWLAYPIQHPGTKMWQACFVYARQQGVGKSFVVDPLMEMIYGTDNFHRLKNAALGSQFNKYAGQSVFVVTNEVYLSDIRDRIAMMGELKDRITSETVQVNEKFQPELKLVDHCNYYFSSQHADGLMLEPNDRRFFVIEAPEDKWPRSYYQALDEWIRKEDGAQVILHHLLHNVDTSDFDPKAEALVTKWKEPIIALSKDALGEFGERVAKSPTDMFMMNGHLPELKLYRAMDLLRLFEVAYPRYRWNVTEKRMSRMLLEAGIERRKVRLSSGEPQVVLYAVFDRDEWREARNRDWARHYKAHSRQFGGRIAERKKAQGN